MAVETKTQRIARKTNRVNKCAKVAGLPYSKFLKVSQLVLKNWPHHTMEDVAEDISNLYSDLDIADYNQDTAEEIASFINDLWEVIY